MPHQLASGIRNLFWRCKYSISSSGCCCHRLRRFLPPPLVCECLLSRYPLLFLYDYCVFLFQVCRFIGAGATLLVLRARFRGEVCAHEYCVLGSFWGKNRSLFAQRSGKAGGGDNPVLIPTAHEVVQIQIKTQTSAVDFVGTSGASCAVLSPAPGSPLLV